jgi:hypothetical protein
MDSQDGRFGPLLRVPLLAGIGCLILLLAALGEANPPVPDEGIQEAYAWFDTLGFPDLARSKYVKVATGNWWRSGEDPPQNSYQYAFLLKEEGQTFTVFTTALATQTFKKTPPGTPEHERVGFEEADLKKVVDAYLKELQKPSDDSRFLRRFGERIGEGAKLFIIARACAQRGYAEQARQMAGQAQKWLEVGRPDKPQSLRQQLCDAFAHSLLWRAVEDFGDPTISRKELLARFEKIAKDFPEAKGLPPADDDAKVNPAHGRHGMMARHYADLLKNMVAEDEAHARKPAKPEQERTRQERIGELIFRLRDQNGHQWSQPGACNIFATNEDGFSYGEGNSPAHQLVKIGYDAVPQLIDVLEDERLTRSVGFHRNFYFSHHVLRVGDCALAILQRISGRRFWEGTSTTAGMTKDQQAAETKKKVQAWWAEFQKKGEKQMLIEGVQAGGYDSVDQGRMLRDRYPDAALDALVEGVAKAPNEWVRTSLIEIVAGIKGERTLAFLRGLLKAPDLQTRVDAARGLLTQGHDDGIQPMIREWQRVPATTEGGEGNGSLIGFLAHCGRAEAIQALGANLRKRPVDERMSILEAVAEVGNDEKKPPSPAVVAARDELLVQALTDTAERRGMSGTWGDKSFSDPRLCDVAGHLLSRLWKQPDAFDLSGTLRTRDRQRVELQNAWRKKQGLELLPLPAPRKVNRLPANEVQPKLQAVLTAPTLTERGKALDAVAALGLGALPAVNETLAGLKADHAARADLQQLAGRLAFSVNEIKLGEASVKPGKDLQQRLAALQGRPLEPAAVVDLLLRITRSLPEGTTGVGLTIDREGDDTGVNVTFTLVAEKVRTGGTQKGWDTYHSIRVGRSNIANSSGFSSLEHGTSEEQWRDFSDGLQKAFEAAPAKSVSARVRIVLEK